MTRWKPYRWQTRVAHEGVLQQYGTPQEIYHKPVNAWVAGFVGEPQ